MSEPTEDLLPPHHGQTGGERRPASPTALLKTVIAQASVIAALMFYLGAMYSSQYYGYFHLSIYSLDFGFAPLVLQSLKLLRSPVLVAVVLVLIAVTAPWYVMRRPLSGQPAQRALAALAPVARLYPVVLAAGLVLLVFWSRIQPYEWAAPLTLAVGFLLGLVAHAAGNRPGGAGRRGLLFFAAVVCLFWVLTETALQLGEKDARARASHVQSWPSVMLLSTRPLSLPPPGVQEEKFARKDLRMPYRYTGLRLLIERSGRYYVVPADWKARTDPVYVIHESDDLWVGLGPGVQ
ncbi:hypothetical protein [Streptomyces sp. NPDC001435]|uniref:hypothetical protein n=1 Tax=unclassified Streptomyces TaxID=2593676 RepID=UPI0036840A9B